MARIFSSDSALTVFTGDTSITEAGGVAIMGTGLVDIVAGSVGPMASAPIPHSAGMPVAVRFMAAPVDIAAVVDTVVAGAGTGDDQPLRTTLQWFDRNKM